jgi:hypothetical protein
MVRPGELVTHIVLLMGFYGVALAALRKFITPPLKRDNGKLVELSREDKETFYIRMASLVFYVVMNLLTIN